MPDRGSPGPSPGAGAGPPAEKRPAGRRYHSPRRSEQAANTRAAILESARHLFVSRGYGRTTVADIARQARVAPLQARLAPVFMALRDAGTRDAESAATWQEIARRRARNMREFAADLRSTGELRDDLSDDDVADIVWSMNGPEYWVLLVGERGWTHGRFAAYLVDAWSRLLLRDPQRDGQKGPP